MNTDVQDLVQQNIQLHDNIKVNEFKFKTNADLGKIICSCMHVIYHFNYNVNG